MEPIKKKGVEVFSIGIGNVQSMSIKDLVTIASNELNVKLATGFSDEINTILTGVVQGKCPGKSQQQYRINSCS